MSSSAGLMSHVDSHEHKLRRTNHEGRYCCTVDKRLIRASRGCASVRSRFDPFNNQTEQLPFEIRRDKSRASLKEVGQTRTGTGTNVSQRSSEQACIIKRPRIMLLRVKRIGPQQGEGSRMGPSGKGSEKRTCTLDQNV